MVEGKLSNGRNMFVVRVEHFVKDSDFANALANKYFSANESFNEKLKKKEAEKILKRSLFFYGLQGQFEDGYFESSFEEGERYNEIYSKAINWVKNNYKWLS